jgi:hypothetical protein
LQYVEVEEFAHIVEKCERAYFIWQVFLQFAILTDVDESEILSDPFEEFLNLLMDDLCLGVVFWNAACD